MFRFFCSTFLLTSYFVVASQQEECGVESQTLIYMGKPSGRLQSPWKAAIFRNSLGGNFDYICGGALINKDTIITGEK